MARNWRELFSNWNATFSETTDARASYAQTRIREALSAAETLKTHRFDVYPTGSWWNNTNTKLESDVDIAVVLNDCFWWELPASGSPTKEELGLGRGVDYGHLQFRDDVGAALTKAFGSAVTAGDKAFDIKASSVRLDADVAVFIEHRRYTGKKTGDGKWHFHEGVEMRPRSDGARRIINWHKQHYDNGVAKNKAVSLRFKRATRMIKRLRDDMKAQGTAAAKDAAERAPSFLIESLTYNVENQQYETSDPYEIVKNVITRAYHQTKSGIDAGLVEVNALKPLFSPSQGWTQEQANRFLHEAWNHVGFGS